MTYDEYVNKITKVAKVRGTVIRFRILISCVSAVVVATTASLVSTKGVVVDQSKLQSSYTYGDKLNYESAAFMNDVGYEFALRDSSSWGFEEPSFPGEYKMRSFSGNNFNGKYYGAEQYFTIEKKALDVEAKDGEYTYGDALGLSGSLLDGDSFVDGYVFSYSEKFPDSLEMVVSPVIDTIKIVNEENTDVTSCYDIQAISKRMPFRKSALSYRSNSETKIYDGAELTGTSLDLLSGTYKYSDRLVCSPKNHFSNVGVADNDYNIQVLDDNDLDVTNFYDISCVAGSLKIEKKPISVSSPSSTCVYDGKDHAFAIDGASLSETTPLASEDAISFVSLCQDESRVRSGEYTNKFKATILRNQVDVTENYDISYSFGTSTITKRELAVTSSSSSVVYDGTAQKNDGYSITKGSLADKDIISNVKVSSFTNAGSFDNDMTFDIVDKDSKADFTDCYDLTIGAGTIEIAKRDITVKIKPLTITYDGKEHKNTEWDVTDGSLASSDAISITKSSKFTDAGTYDNDDFAIDIKNGEVSEKSNYNVTIEGSKSSIVIEKRKISIKVPDIKKTYDGKSALKTTTGDLYSITDGTLAADEYIDFSITNDVTDVGTTAIEFSVDIYHQIGEEADKKTDTLVNSNYNVTATAGNFDIAKRSLTITTSDVSHDYNRDTDLSILGSDLYAISGDGLVSGHSLAASGITCSGVNVGTYDYDVDEDSIKIEDASKNNVTGNYDITVINTGHLTIEKRPVSISLTNQKHVYDGAAFSSSDYLADNLVGDDRVRFSGLPSVTHVSEGAVANTPSNAEIFTSDNQDVTSNYDISLSSGTIQIEKRKITLTSETRTDEYDGEVMGDTGVEVGGLGLASTDTLNVLSEKSQELKYAFSDPVDNTFTYSITNDDGLNVENDYDVTAVTLGKLLITKRKITLTSDTVEKVFDGTTIGSTNVTVDEKGLGVGDTLSVSNMIENQVRYVEDSTDNVFDYVIKDTSGVDMKDNYDVTKVMGKLVILPRSVSFSNYAMNKIYDGEAYTVSTSIMDVTALTDVLYLSDGTIPAGYHVSAQVTLGGGFKVGEYSDWTVTFTAYDSSWEQIDIGNYDITKDLSAYTILARDILVQSQSGIMEYDEFGTGFENNPQITFGSLSSTDTIMYGSVEKLFQVGTNMDNPIGTITIMNLAKGVDVTSCYNIVLVYGKVTIVEHEN